MPGQAPRLTIQRLCCGVAELVARRRLKWGFGSAASGPRVSGLANFARLP